jgi:tripartite-type tricarboxylate transporter receptor subunit TctC
MTIQRRHFITAWLALTVSATATAQAQSYPNRPIRIVVPYAAGGPVDVVARVIGERLENYFQQRVLVDNRAGGNAAIGTEFVARSAPDGYTLLMGAPAHTANPSLMKLNFDTARDFLPISNIIEQPMVIAVHPSVPANNLRELIDLLRANPDKYNFGTSGAGGPQHLMGEIFKAATSTRIVHIPYKGAAPALFDMLAGQCQVMFATSLSVQQYIRTNKLRPLAVTTATRAPDRTTYPSPGRANAYGIGMCAWPL